MKETEVAQYAVDLLHDLRFDCYYEVPLATGRADIIAVLGSVVWIVETKVSFSLALLDQAARRLRERCSGVLLVTGSAPRRDGAALQWCEQNGVGVVCMVGGLRAWPALRRVDTSKLRASLQPEHKTFAQAGSCGTYWTPFKRLSTALAASLQPGPLAEQMERLLPLLDDYKPRRKPSAQRRAVAEYLAGGLIEGWGLKREGRQLLVVRRVEIGLA